MSFYLTLPSNASFEKFPNNTLSDYTTVLARSIELDRPYEVAVVGFYYPPALSNFVGNVKMTVNYDLQELAINKKDIQIPVYIFNKSHDTIVQDLEKAINVGIKMDYYKNIVNLLNVHSDDAKRVFNSIPSRTAEMKTLLSAMELYYGAIKNVPGQTDISKPQPPLPNNRPVVVLFQTKDFILKRFEYFIMQKVDSSVVRIFKDFLKNSDIARAISGDFNAAILTLKEINEIVKEFKDYLNFKILNIPEVKKVENLNLSVIEQSSIYENFVSELKTEDFKDFFSLLKPPPQIEITTNKVQVHFDLKTGIDNMKVDGILAQLLSDSTSIKDVLEIKTDTNYRFPNSILSSNYALIYSDVVENQYFGDSYLPILQVVPLQTDTPQEIVSYFDQPHYVNVAKSRINSINIRLSDLLGEKIRFETRTAFVIVRLHFRPVQ